MPTRKGKPKWHGGKKLKAIHKAWGKGGATLQVGFFKDAKYQTGEQVAQVAAWNEFGVKNKQGKWVIPPRPFFRKAIDTMEWQILPVLQREVDPRVCRVSKQTAERLGVLLQAHLQEWIVRLRTPPNAPKTIRLKGGKSNPLIDTAKMKGSVTYKVRGGV